MTQELDFLFSRLRSGISVVSYTMPTALTTSVGIWLPVGARHEPERLGGAFHFLEHMLFKGTGKRNAFRISSEIEEAGGQLNAFTAEDHMCFYAQAAARHLPRMLDVLSDMLLHSVLPEKEVERERGVIREEIQMVTDQPAQKVEELLAAAMFNDHPLGRPVTGTLETVDAITRADLVALHRRLARNRGVVVSAAGATSHEELVDLVEKKFGSIHTIERGFAFKRWNGRRTQSEPVRIEEGRAEQTHLALGFHAYGRHDPRRFALRLLSVILGETMSSRLFQNLRERRGLCYSVNSSVSSLHETGTLILDAAAEPERAFVCLRLMLDEIRSLANRGPTSREFDRAREYALGQIDMHLEGPHSFMTWLGESIIGYQRAIDPSETRDRFRTVTRADIQACAADLTRPESRALGIFGPLPNPEKIRHTLWNA